MSNNRCKLDGRSLLNFFCFNVYNERGMNYVDILHLQIFFTCLYGWSLNAPKIGVFIRFFFNLSFLLQL